jgi:hypothetical protein
MGEGHLLCSPTAAVIDTDKLEAHGAYLGTVCLKHETTRSRLSITTDAHQTTVVMDGVLIKEGRPAIKQPPCLLYSVPRAFWTSAYDSIDLTRRWSTAETPSSWCCSCSPCAVPHRTPRNTTWRTLFLPLIPTLSHLYQRWELYLGLDMFRDTDLILETEWGLDGTGVIDSRQAGDQGGCLPLHCRAVDAAGWSLHLTKTRPRVNALAAVVVSLVQLHRADRTALRSCGCNRC